MPVDDGRGTRVVAIAGHVVDASPTNWLSVPAGLTQVLAHKCRATRICAQGSSIPNNATTATALLIAIQISLIGEIVD